MGRDRCSAASPRFPLNPNTSSLNWLNALCKFYYLAPWPQLEYPAGPGDDQLDLVPGGGGDEGHGQAAVELRRPRLVYLRVKRVD